MLFSIRRASGLSINHPKVLSQERLIPLICELPPLKIPEVGSRWAFVVTYYRECPDPLDRIKKHREVVINNYKRNPGFSDVIVSGDQINYLRKETDYTIELDSLEELTQLVEDLECEIIVSRSDNPHELLIYDDYL